MSNKQMIEKIKREYELYEVEDVYRLGTVLQFIYDAYEDAYCDRDLLRVDKTKNIFDKVMSRIFGTVIEFYRDYPTSEFYAYDNKMIGLAMDMNKDYCGRLTQLREVVNDDNMQEVYRLAKFTVYKYNANMSFVSAVRTFAKSEGEYIGIDYVSSGDEVGFRSFFEEEIKVASHVDKKVYSKQGNM